MSNELKIWNGILKSIDDQPESLIQLKLPG